MTGVSECESTCCVSLPSNSLLKPCRQCEPMKIASQRNCFAAAIISVLGLKDSVIMVSHSTPAALAVWLGTPLLFYMYVAPPFSHACSAFAVALFVWTWMRVRGSMYSLMLTESQ